MPRGESGRIVIITEPELKNDLYDALQKDGLTLKDWFEKQATAYLHDKDQLMLLQVAEPQGRYNK